MKDNKYIVLTKRHRIWLGRAVQQNVFLSSLEAKIRQRLSEGHAGLGLKRNRGVQMDICAQQRIPVQIRISVGAARPRGTLPTVEECVRSSVQYRAADSAAGGFDSRYEIGVTPSRAQSAEDTRSSKGECQM